MSSKRLSLAMLAAAVACTGDAPTSGLVLGLQTDLVVPEDTNFVGLFVTQLSDDGQRKALPPMTATPIRGDDGRYTVQFSATLVLQSNSKERERIHTRFVAFDAQNQPLVMREARTTLPNQGTQLLRLPLLWINSGRVRENNGVSTSSLALRDVTTDQAFGRFSTEGCNAEETLGDDGTCRSIDDVALVDLGGSSTPPEESCFDAEGCFDGPEVRSFAITLDAEATNDCSLRIDPTRNTEKPALALSGENLGGYEVAGRRLRPVDDVLYAFDAASSTLTLGPALCAKVRREGISTAVVSAKCAPKKVVAVCADWQRTSQKEGPSDGLFADDDALDGGLPDGALPDGALPDGGLDRPILNQIVDLAHDGLLSMAARQNRLWLLVRTTDPATGAQTTEAWHGAMGSPSMQRVTAFGGRFGIHPGQLMLGPQTPPNAYLVANNADGENIHHLRLPYQELASPLVFCSSEAACNGGADAGTCSMRRQLTLGDGEGGTVGITEGTRFELQGWRAVTPNCFVSLGEVGGTNTPHVRLGAPLADSFVAPAGFSPNEFLSSFGQVRQGALSQQNPAVNPPLSTASDQGFGELAAFGDGEGMVLHRTPDATLFYRVRGAFGAWVVNEPLSYTNGDVAPFFFGGPKVACAPTRIGRLQFSAVCIQDHEAQLRFVDSVIETTNTSSMVYSDPEYMYFARTCSSTQIAVRGVPWEKLQGDTLENAFVGMCP